MNIPKKLETLLAQVESIKTLIIAATQKGNFREVSRLSLDWAKTQGELSIVEAIVAWHSDEADDGQVAEQLVDIALRGADDAWSGRGNDFARANHDGKLEAISWFRDGLRFSE